MLPEFSLEKGQALDQLFIAAGFGYMASKLVQTEAGGLNSFTIENGYNENFKYEMDDGLSLIMTEAGAVHSMIFEPGRFTHSSIMQRFSKLVRAASEEFQLPQIKDVLLDEGEQAIIIPGMMIDSTTWFLEMIPPPNGDVHYDDDGASSDVDI